MPWNTENLPESMMGLDYTVRIKAMEMANAMEEDGQDEETILSSSQTQAQDWFDNASEEEKEELRKRYPEDKLRKD